MVGRNQLPAHHDWLKGLGNVASAVHQLLLIQVESTLPPAVAPVCQPDTPHSSIDGWVCRLPGPAVRLRLTPLNPRIIQSSAGTGSMREMRALLTIFVLGINAAGADAATIQSPASVGTSATADTGQTDLPTTSSPGPAPQGDDPLHWPTAAPVAVSKGGSAKGYKSRGGGRHHRSSSRAGGRSSLGHGGPKHGGGKSKGAR